MLNDITQVASYGGVALFQLRTFLRAGTDALKKSPMPRILLPPARGIGGRSLEIVLGGSMPPDIDVTPVRALASKPPRGG